MFGFKILLAIFFLYSLIIPLSIKPVSGLYNIGELTALRAYCFLHADRAAQGENVVNDLIKSGLANSTYHDWSCSKINETLQAEEKAESQNELSESQTELSFTRHCSFDILTPSQVSECSNAGHTSFNPDTICIFEEDIEDMEWKFNLSQAEPLTPAERLECENAGYEPGHAEDKYTK